MRVFRCLLFVSQLVAPRLPVFVVFLSGVSECRTASTNVLGEVATPPSFVVLVFRVFVFFSRLIYFGVTPLLFRAFERRA